MTPARLKAELKRMRKLFAEGKLKEAAELAAVLAPFVHQELPPIVISTVRCSGN